jgi:site-specific recombinase XerD
MALALYRRHRRECKAGHREDLRTSEYEERKKGWKRCECPILASGTLAQKFRRQTTGQWEWEHARAIARQWEADGSWNAAPVNSINTSAASVKKSSETVQIPEAIEAFLAKCKNRNIQPSTLGKYRTFTNQFAAYCENKGYVHLNHLDVNDADKFYASWNEGIRSRAKKLERFKAFVKFAKKRGWIETDITEDLQAPEGSSIVVPKAPFTDEELARIYSACECILPAPRPGPGYRTWHGADARDFIDLSIYTGLRISDVCLFDINKRLHGNDVFLRTHKTGAPINTWIPDWLVERLQARVATHGPMIFRCGVTMNAKQLCDIWRNKRLKMVFDLSGPWAEKPHHHRCRHTFVRILLEKGVSLADVAELIGDTEQMVRTHYSKFVKSRQARLTRILQEAFEDRPKKLLSIEGGKR